MMKFKRMLVEISKGVFQLLGIVEIIILLPIAIVGGMAGYGATIVIQKTLEKLK